MYKLVRPNGKDFYSGTISYADAVGSVVEVLDYDPPQVGACGKGLHACKNPNDCFVGAKIPCRAFKVEGVGLLAEDRCKSRFKKLRVIEEIFDLNSLFGWDYEQAINPINPFKITPPKTITEKHIKLLKEIAVLQNSVRATVRDSVWDSVWDSVGSTVWDSVIDSVGSTVCDSVWDSVGSTVCDSVIDSVGSTVWASVVYSVVAYIGSFFLNVKKWKYIDHEEGQYPFQPYVDLWRMGLVPSFDGNKWRLHGGAKAEILWEGKP